MPFFLHLFASIQLAMAQGLTVQEQYDLGQKYLRRGYYTKALDQFTLIRNYYRDDPLSMKAELAIADVYYKKGEFDLARYSYNDFFRRYPRHEQVDYAYFRSGMTLYKKAPRVTGRDQTWTAQAIRSWSNFENKFPQSEHVEEVVELRTECEERLAKKELDIAVFYKRRAAWEAVLRRTAYFLRTHTSSRYVPQAMALRAIALTHSGMDADAAKLLSKLNTIDAVQAKKTESKMRKIRQNSERPNSEDGGED